MRYDLLEWYSMSASPDTAYNISVYMPVYRYNNWLLTADPDDRWQHLTNNISNKKAFLRLGEGPFKIEYSHILMLYTA